MSGEQRSVSTKALSGVAVENLYRRRVAAPSRYSKGLGFDFPIHSRGIVGSPARVIPPISTPELAVSYGAGTTTVTEFENALSSVFESTPVTQ